MAPCYCSFPWSFRRTDDEPQWLDDVTRAFAEFPLVVEVRHASWAVPDFYAELVERGIGFVNIDQPLFHNSIKPSATATAPVGYVRIHGRNYRDWFRKDAGVEARYDYLYTPAELTPWAERSVEVAESGADEVYAITNNHYRAKAAVNAIQLKSMVRDEPVPAPETLYASTRTSWRRGRTRPEGRRETGDGREARETETGDGRKPSGCSSSVERSIAEVSRPPAPRLPSLVTASSTLPRTAQSLAGRSTDLARTSRHGESRGRDGTSRRE